MSHSLKPWNSIEEQISRLRSRGMVIDDAEARTWLGAVGYYRLSGYWYPYVSEPAARGNMEPNFVSNTAFHEIVQLYEFDRKLRELSLSAIERIEVGFRSRLSYELGRDDPEGHLDEANFSSERDHRAINDIACKRIVRAISSKDPVALHHESKYCGKYPVWAVTEFFDFSDISRLYAALVPEKKIAVADYFGFSPAADGFNSSVRGKLEGWLHNLTIVRQQILRRIIHDSGTDRSSPPRVKECNGSLG